MSAVMTVGLPKVSFKPVNAAMSLAVLASPVCTLTSSERLAATTLVVRDGASGPEVLMVRRSMQAIFMPGAYVFPGGAVDPVDGSPASERMCDESAAALVRRIGTVTQVGDAALGYAVAALRECFEECGLWLGAPAATPLRWGDLRAQLNAGEPIAARRNR